MDLKHLEAFAAIVETGSFGKAAEALYKTQPTISACVMALEQEIGVRLFDRGAGKTHVTEAGEVLYGYAKRMLALREEAMEAVGAAAGKCVISVAASSIPARYYLPELMAAFWGEHSDVSFEVSEKDSDAVIKSVLSGQAEIGFCGTHPEDGRINCTVTAIDRLVVVTPDRPEYRAYLDSGFPAGLFAALPVIAREQGSGTRTETEKFLRGCGIEPESLNITAELDSTEAIKQLVSGGAGVSVLSRSAAADYLNFGRLLAFDFEGGVMERKLYAIRKKGGIINPAAREFFAFSGRYFTSRRS